MIKREIIRWSMALLWLALYIFFYRNYEKEEEKKEEIDRKENSFLSFYYFLANKFSFLGVGFYRLLPISSPALDRKKLSWFEVLKGKGEGERWLELDKKNCARDIFLLAGLLPVFLFFSDLFWIILCFIALRYYASIYFLKTKANKEKEIVEREIQDLLAGLVLALRAGMILDRAWQEVSRNKSGPLFEEMRRVSQLRKEGIGFNQAYLSFADRYQIEILKDFNQLIIQNVELGGSELARGIDQLRRKESKAMINRMHKAADRAQEQMLLPSLLQFIGILLLLLVPLFSQTHLFM